MTKGPHKSESHQWTLDNEVRRMQAIRLQMVEAHPFWGYLLLQVRLVPTTGLPGFAATDCMKHIWYNPENTRYLDDQQLGFVLAHEVGHQLLASGFRQNGRDATLWNCATDYVINRMVDAIPMPGNSWRSMYRTPNGNHPLLGEVSVLLDRRFDGMIAETIYDVLASQGQRPEAATELTLVSWQSDGQPVKVQLPGILDHKGGIDVHLPEAHLSPLDTEELGNRISDAAAAWERSDGTGDRPEALLREIRRRTKHSVPWQRLLRAFAGQALARDDWSLARPNSRYIDQGIVLPGPYSDKAGQLVLSVDSSGSMSAPLLEAVGAELNAIAREAEEITIIVSDSRVRQVVKEADVARFLANLKLKGGGGTDHRPVFDYLKAARITPDLFIGLTDLYTVLPPKKPPFPVLWAVPPKHAAAPWGHTVVFTPQPTPPDINNIMALINSKRDRNKPGGPRRLAIPLHR